MRIILWLGWSAITMIVSLALQGVIVFVWAMLVQKQTHYISEILILANDLGFFSALGTLIALLSLAIVFLLFRYRPTPRVAAAWTYLLITIGVSVLGLRWLLAEASLLPENMKSPTTAWLWASASYLGLLVLFILPWVLERRGLQNRVETDTTRTGVAS